VSETFLQLLLLFAVSPALYKVSVNSVVARVPVVRNCVSMTILMDTFILTLHYITLLPFSPESCAYILTCFKDTCKLKYEYSTVWYRN
jgi:hypothetical protein